MTHEKAIEEALHLNGFATDVEKINKFNILIDLVLKWVQTINITAHRTPSDIIYKDIIDNLYLHRFITSYQFPDIRCIDMGAGAGFSGLVLSIAEPEAKVTFLEADRKKINFTREVCRQTGLKQATFIQDRAEANPKSLKGAYICSITRATWPLGEYLQYASHYVQNSGHVFFMSGKSSKNHRPEIPTDQGFAEAGQIFYKIEPKQYERSIFAFKKIGLAVSRGTP